MRANLVLIFLLGCCSGFINSQANASNLPVATFSPTLSTIGHSQASATTLGWAFNVNQTITVTELGYFDSGSDGLYEEHAVGIFDRNGILLSSAIIPSGTLGQLSDGFRYVEVTQFSLLPGSYTAAATIGASAGDPLPYFGTFTTISQISIPEGASRYTEAGTYTSLSYPDLKWPVNNPYPFYLGPNFQIASVPLPAAFWLFSSALVCLRVLGKKRAAQVFA